MRVLHVGDDAKGWLAGPWDDSAPIGLGYANEAIDEPHLHETITEIFLVASGTATVNVEGAEVSLAAGDVLILEAGEAHTFIESSDDYRAFVIHTGWPGGSDKILVHRNRLGPTASG
jgi:mannose-6-phosphate isomerase-like protein (cupin superfamily)